MSLQTQVVAQSRSMGMNNFSNVVRSNSIFRQATGQFAITLHLEWANFPIGVATLLGRSNAPGNLCRESALGHRRLVIAAAGKQKSKLSSDELDIRVSATCMCNRCQIMRPLLERYEQIKDRVEMIPQVTVKHVELNFARSGGAGGQNVNKVNTKVDMRFNVMEATWLPERVRLKLLENEKNRINKDGEIVVSSSRTRKQKDNLEDALDKVQEMINAAYAAAPSEKERTATLLKKLDRGRR